MNDLNCPYCDAGLNVCHDDGFGYDEDRSHEMECSECGKNFVFRTAISFEYYPEKADCLNGAPHDFKDWRFLWNRADKTMEYRMCKDCEYQEQRTKLAKQQ